MFPAENGDAFLISCKGEKPTNILVDMGYENTYKQFIKPRLLELKEKGEALDLIVLTHIDADHIEGAQFFFEENGFHHDPKVIGVNEVWHNSYRHLSMNEKEQLLDETLANKVSRKVNAIPTKRSKNENTKVSTEQGSRIASLLYKYEYPWNIQFNGHAILSSETSVVINNEVNLMLLTPTPLQLEKLKGHWRTGLKKLFPGIPLTKDQILDDAIEFVSYFYPDQGVPNASEKTSMTTGLTSLANSTFREDRSIINGSSITFLLEFNGKRILFLGDIPPSILKDVIKSKLANGVYPLYFDAIKVSHHGSKANNSKDLLEIIDSNVYLISTDGSRHKHPHLESLARIVVRENLEKDRVLYFNYKTDASVKISEPSWQEKYNYSVSTAEEGESSNIII